MAEKTEKTSKQAPTPKKHEKRLISLNEYRAEDKRVTTVLEAGFRVWMKTDKREPLRARHAGEWNKLIDQYLQS